MQVEFPSEVGWHQTGLSVVDLMKLRLQSEMPHARTSDVLHTLHDTPGPTSAQVNGVLLDCSAAGGEYDALVIWIQE